MKKLDCKILIVDDNEELLEAFEMFLSPHFKLIETLKKPDTALARHRTENFDIILLDMNFKAGINSGNEGIYWMNKILEQDPQATIVFITAYGDIELAVKTIKEVLDIGLKEAKNHVDFMPSTLKNYATMKEAVKIQNALEEFGCDVEITNDEIH